MSARSTTRGTLLARALTTAAGSASLDQHQSRLAPWWRWEAGPMERSAMARSVALDVDDLAQRVPDLHEVGGGHGITRRAQ
jgi:hypothetical protein